MKKVLITLLLGERVVRAWTDYVYLTPQFISGLQEMYPKYEVMVSDAIVPSPFGTNF
jgi:hypothetical protein